MLPLRMMKGSELAIPILCLPVTRDLVKSSVILTCGIIRKVRLSLEHEVVGGLPDSHLSRLGDVGRMQ